MKRTITRCIVVLLLQVAAIQQSFAQYFNVLYDFDSTADWGLNVFIQPDSGNNYLIFGRVDNFTNEYNGLMWMTIAEDGSSVIHRHFMDTASISEIYEGNPGAVKQLSNGGYVIPLNPETYYSSSISRSSAGIIRLNASLDTVFTKLYTDTTVFFDVLNDLALMPDGGYLLGGYRQGNTAATSLGLLIRTDSLGDTLWSRTYSYDPAKSCEINTVEALSNGNILAGAMSTTTSFMGSYEFYDNQPWFLVLDSLGNIVKDTLYGTRFGGGGGVYTDVNGGYYQWGSLDSFLSTDYSSYDNFPGYVAHLDSNFRVQWFILLGGVQNYYRVWEVKQLLDSNYLLVVQNEDSIYSYDFSSLTKIDRAGNITWHQEYEKDTNNSWATDAKELPNGNIVFTGASFNPSEPGSWRQDVWLVSVDSNGCEVPGCWPSKIEPLTPKGGFSLFPNPTEGNVTIKTSDAGVLEVYTMQGQKISAYKIERGETSLQLPRGISAGIYVAAFTDDNGVRSVVRLVYQPW